MKINRIKIFQPINKNTLLSNVLQTADWIEKYGHIEGDEEHWDVAPGKTTDNRELLLNDTSVYGGAAGISLFYIRLFDVTGEEKWLIKAEAGINYCIKQYQGKEAFFTNERYLPGAYTGYMNGPSGGAYVALKLYQTTGKEEYKTFALRVADDAVETAEEGKNCWSKDYSFLGGGGLILFLLEIYEFSKKKKYLDTAKKAAEYILDQKEESPWGGYRWYVMPTDTFPTIRKAGGYFPGFEYGAAGCGYILAKVYEYTKDERFLTAAKKAAEYIKNIADYSEDHKAALVRYNDTYLTDLYYLGVCQGPIGTSRLFYELYCRTGEESYKTFVLQLTDGLLLSGAPLIHSRGYWRTNCYCCGGAGMLEHFINIHKLTGNRKYLEAAYNAAESVIGESTTRDELRMWYTSWNRHEPEKSDTYTGLYHGSTGCASSLLYFYQYLTKNAGLVPYLEDPYKRLFL